LRLSGFSERKTTRVSSGVFSIFSKIVFSISLAPEKDFSHENGNQSISTSLFSLKRLRESILSIIKSAEVPSREDI